MKTLGEHTHDTGRVWFATLEEIAAHVKTLVDTGAWTPRVDRRPCHPGPILDLGEAGPRNVDP